MQNVKLDVILQNTISSSHRQYQKYYYTECNTNPFLWSAIPNAPVRSRNEREYFEIHPALKIKKCF